MYVLECSHGYSKCDESIVMQREQCNYCNAGSNMKNGVSSGQIMFNFIEMCESISVLSQIWFKQQGRRVSIALAGNQSKRRKTELR